MRIKVPSYGLHWIKGGIGLLVQDEVTDITGVDLGLKVTIDQIRLPPSPHRIDLEARSNQQLPDHPLILSSLPIPKENIQDPLFVADTIHNRNVIKSLLRLSSSTGSNVMFPIWMPTPVLISKMLKLTNLTPLILHSYTHQLRSRLDVIEGTIRQNKRQVIVMGDAWSLPGMKSREELNFEIDDLPLEKIGAHHLYERMSNDSG